jgi:hypothetical protein
MYAVCVVECVYMECICVVCVYECGVYECVCVCMRVYM